MEADHGYHDFLITKTDTSGKVVGVQCVRCGKIALYMPNGAVSSVLSKEECQHEHANQATVLGRETAN
jgi:hypothetical protein